jgi:DmsE family decaheme c-type cytochrome
VLSATGAAIGGALLVMAAGPRSAAAQKPPLPSAAEQCAVCHEAQTMSWAASLHRRTVGAPQIPADRQACAACHSGIEGHLSDVMDKTKRPALPTEGGDASGVCLSCHRGGQQAMWQLSAHARLEGTCLACHDPHAGKGTEMLKAPEPELCQSCHPNEVAEGNLPSHHPVLEGKMLCSDCHTVHGDERGNLPEASNGEMCFRCHPEKQGPFIAEHPPVTEDCTICHRPHGSPVDNLLVMDQPMLCLRCHPGHSSGLRSPLVPITPGDPAGPQAVNGLYSRCTSCHSRIHGTDLLSGTQNPTFMPGYPLTPVDPVAGLGDVFTAAVSDAALWGFAEGDLARFDEDGNPAYVREYDGRHYNLPASRTTLSKYGQEDDLWFEVVDFPRGDPDFNLRAGNPRYDIRVRASGLTHRLGRFDDSTDVLIPASDGGTRRVNATDLSGGRTDYRIRRGVVDVRLAARCPRLANVKWLFNYWEQEKSGARQFLFLDRCTSCHKIQTTEPIDQVVTIAEGGFEVNWPKASLRYLHGQQDFDNKATEGLFDFTGRSIVFSGRAPLFGVADSRTSTNDLRGAAMLGSRTSLAALWRTKAKEDELGGGTVDIQTAGGGLARSLSPDLRLQVSRFQRHFDVDKLGDGISRDRNTTRVDLRYTGLPRATWSLGYAKETVARRSIEEREMVPDKSDSSTWTSSLTYRPLSRTFLLVRYRNTRTDNGGFFLDFDPDEPPTHLTMSRLIGLPNEGRVWSAVLSHEFGPGTQLNMMYNRRRDSYEATFPALGLHSSSDMGVRTKGFSLSQQRARSHLGAGWYRQVGDAEGQAVYGSEDFVLSPPLVPADVTFPPIVSSDAYQYRASIQTVDATVWFSSRVRLFGNCSRTATNGSETLYDLGDYLDQNPDLNGVALILHPFDTEIRDLWLGMGYFLDPNTEAVLSHQRRSWVEAADASHNGSLDIWRLGVRRSF